MTAVNEEAPLGGIKICQRTAAKEEYRIPGAPNLEIALRY
jgi:hypothetical protein